MIIRRMSRNGRAAGQQPSRRVRRAARVTACMSATAAFVLGAVVATSGAATASARSKPSGSGLVVADVAPFTGPDAALGPTYLVSCDAVTNAINEAGGVLGHPLSCKAVDTRGDPADAVPAVQQLFASTPNVSLVIGCTSDEAASVVPIINAHKVVMFCMTGQSEFTHIKFPYFFRLVPPDLATADAMVAIAKYHTHYKRIALAFGNDIGSQTFVTPAVQAIHKAGLDLVANLTLDLTSTTFRTEAARIVAAHPDVIFTEALGSTDATFLSEVKQQNGGKPIPVIGTSATISPTWYASVSKAVGAAYLTKDYEADNLVTLTSGPAYEAFKKAIFSMKGKVGNAGNFTTYLSAPGAVHLYDGINLAALAMVEAKSTKPSVYKPYVLSIGNGAPGAVVVHTFAQGVAALKKGKKIRYIGPGGPSSFDAYHDSPGIFQIDKYGPKGQVIVAGTITTNQLRSVK
jgi:ABC-type branched-subunit amino acid transport system substrate-binding protein